jgi:hypothetical protein
VPFADGADHAVLGLDAGRRALLPLLERELAGVAAGTVVDDVDALRQAGLNGEAVEQAPERGGVLVLERDDDGDAPCVELAALTLGRGRVGVRVRRGEGEREPAEPEGVDRDQVPGVVDDARDLVGCTGFLGVWSAGSAAQVEGELDGECSAEADGDGCGDLPQGCEGQASDDECAAAGLGESASVVHGVLLFSGMGVGGVAWAWGCPARGGQRRAPVVLARLFAAGTVHSL